MNLERARTTGFCLWLVCALPVAGCGDDGSVSLDANVDAKVDATADVRSDAPLPDAANDAGCGTGASTDDGPLRAFPTAEGFGAQAEGGRAGEVVEVTSLADSGPGTLREALTACGPPRTIVFRTGGTIVLTDALSVADDHITIAGQTAPGDGIQIRNDGGNHATMVITGSHVIIRHLRLRSGPGGQPDTLRVSNGSSDVIIDHCSLSWSVDEIFSTYQATNNTTVQWTILSEPLHNSTHDTPHSMAMLTGPATHRFTSHHNFFAHGGERIPRVQGGDHQFVNNLIYDFQRGAYFGATGDTVQPMRALFLGNYYRHGPLTGYDFPVDLGAAQAFVEGNMWENLEGTASSTDVFEGGMYRSQEEFADFPEISLTPAATLSEVLLPQVGATLPHRDPVDTRVIAKYEAGTGGYVDHPSDVGGWPEMQEGTPAPDTDHDGMPDAWETGFGLDSDDPADGALDLDGDGYTNLEEFLNQTIPGCP